MNNQNNFNTADRNDTLPRHGDYVPFSRRLLVATLAFAAVTLSHAASAVTTYRTVDVAAAIGHGAGWSSYVIRGDVTDVDLVNELGIHPSFANPNGSLSYKYLYGLPFGQPDAEAYLSATSTWDNFVVSGASVNVLDFDLNGVEVASVGSGGSFWNVAAASGADQYIRTTFDGRMESFIRLNFTYSGPVPDFVGQSVQSDVMTYGGYVLNDAATGLQTSTASQFDFLGDGADQAAADYLNFVAANHLPADWTQAGLWYYGTEMTTENTRGDLAAFYIGGEFWGYNVWYSTDPFVYAKPVGDPDNGGIVSLDDIGTLIANGEFPDVDNLELLGMRLAGSAFAQLFEVVLIDGNGEAQEIAFTYDESLISPGEEALLAIAHFTDGAWVLPPQVLNTDTNTILVTLGSFSPFALVAPVPVPAAVWFLGSGLAGLWLRGSAIHRSHRNRGARANTRV